MAQPLDYRTPPPPDPPQPWQSPASASLICAGTTGSLLLLGTHPAFAGLTFVAVILMPVLQIAGIVTGVQGLWQESRWAAVGLCANAMLAFALAMPLGEIASHLL